MKPRTAIEQAIRSAVATVAVGMVIAHATDLTAKTEAPPEQKMPEFTVDRVSMTVAGPQEGWKIGARPQFTLVARNTGDTPAACDVVLTMHTASIQPKHFDSRSAGFPIPSWNQPCRIVLAPGEEKAIPLQSPHPLQGGTVSVTLQHDSRSMQMLSTSVPMFSIDLPRVQATAIDEQATFTPLAPVVANSVSRR